MFDSSLKILLYMWQWCFIQNQVQNFIDVQYKSSNDPSLPQIPPHSTRFSVATLLPCRAEVRIGRPLPPADPFS